MKSRSSILILVTVVVASVLGGILGGEVRAISSDEDGKSLLKTFSEAIDVIERNYVDQVDTEKLIHNAIRGMLRSLDPHSIFFDREEFSKLREEQHSRYFGLGIRIRPMMRGSNTGPVLIVEPPFPGSPAYKKGLRAGDIITKVEGEAIDDWTTDEIIGRLKGPKGTRVNITVERYGLSSPLEIQIERDEIHSPAVPFAFLLQPGLGYVKVDRFAETTTRELKESISRLGELSRGLLLDLRDNPGGMLNEAWSVADLFLPKGAVIVATKGRAPGSTKSYDAKSSNDYEYPLAVLINNNSASASEIVAGAIQDHDRGLVVGETSFGKGLVQSVYPLESGTGVALTTAKYYTPSGRLIQRDYSGSLYDYFAPHLQARAGEKREVRYTDGGRKVYGGGGIAPDVEVRAKELNKFQTLLLTRDVFLQYGRRLVSGEVPAASSFRPLERVKEIPDEDERRAKLAQIVREFKVTDGVLDDFKDFLTQKKIEYTQDAIRENFDFVERKLRQEVSTSTLGLEEGFRVAIEEDEQVARAVAVLPQARELNDAALARNRR
ncbi:MAG: S41 family peptidase [Acidobacteria bacterium]|nr:S41 family peptidase [Acidobacteriota bacterium]